MQILYAIGKGHIPHSHSSTVTYAMYFTGVSDVQRSHPS